MTRDEIVEIGRQAGMDYIEYISDESMKQVEKFIGLIEAKEREACAKLADEIDPVWESISDAIRARGEA